MFARLYGPRGVFRHLYLIIRGRTAIYDIGIAGICIIAQVRTALYLKSVYQLPMRILQQRRNVANPTNIMTIQYAPVLLSRLRNSALIESQNAVEYQGYSSRSRVQMGHVRFAACAVLQPPSNSFRTVGRMVSTGHDAQSD